MRKFVFYPKLSAQNIKRNSKFYFPFILTCIATTAMFYIMCFLTFNEGLKKMPGNDYLSLILNLGCIVIGIFSAIFLFYTNSFLMKRRQKELGLYNILGMGKKNLASVLFFETLYVTLITLVSGLAFGILLSKLTLLLLCKLVNFPVPFGFEISLKSILYCIYLFGGIFIIILISSLIRIKLSNPIELLRGGNVGEKEPKTKWILSILGIISLGAGYYIAIVTNAPLQAILLFFVAVILVIIGTYLLFTTSSIAILKRLKSKSSYYYNTNHFIPVSGMIYRMKQNAVGLANICILATMVLVMVSGTVCLYIGTEDAIQTRYPNEINILVSKPTGDTREKIYTAIINTVNDSGLKTENIMHYSYLDFVCLRNGNNFDKYVDTITNQASYSYLIFLTSSEYERITGEKLTLAPDEAIAYPKRSKLNNSFTIWGKSFEIICWLDDFPIVGEGPTAIGDYYYFIVNDDSYAEVYESQSEREHRWYMGVNVNGTSQQKIDCSNAIISLFSDSGYDLGTYEYATVTSREADKEFIYIMNGGFLFLGLFLGLVFLIATVLIIYYKQLSEGYEDKDRFEIMQKVGLSRPEIKKAIHSQVLIVFFLPLGMAILHIAFAFKMITKLLLVFNLTNVPLFAVCTLCTVAVFIVIYLVVYLLTAKVYYKLVS